MERALDLEVEDQREIGIGYTKKTDTHSSPINHGRPLTFHVLLISYKKNKYAVIIR